MKKTKQLIFLFATLAVSALSCLGSLSHAEILIGQTVGVTGSVAATVKESNIGAMIYLNAVNAADGLYGEKIKLITLDDKFDTKLTFENAKNLIEEKKVLALFMTRGTPNTESILPLLEKYGVPLISPSTGAIIINNPVKRYVFNTRATYQAEAKKSISYLLEHGMNKISVIHVDDSFGADVLQGINQTLGASKINLASVSKFDRSKPDFSAASKTILDKNPQVVFIVGSGTSVVEAIKSVRKTGSKAKFVTLSNNASFGFTKLLGDQAQGVMVTQVFPSEQETSYSMIRDVIRTAKLQGVQDISPAIIEGFVAAKVLVEALKMAGPSPTREKVHAALERINNFNIGGLNLTFSATNHSGLDFVKLSMINAEGKFRNMPN